MKRDTRGVGRRTFLAGLLTGGGVAASLGAAAGRAAPVPAPGDTTREPPTPGPVLFRRTAEAERYYRTLYR